MQTTAKWVRKELKQFITVYQWILEFSLEKVWLEVIIKHNKQDADDMLDDVNAKLIEICEEYLQSHKLWMDKFQLATVVMDLYTQTISQLETPFKVIAKESKALVQEYLEKNKSKREALERIKSENDSLDKELAEQKRENARKNKEISMETPGNDFIAKPEMPRKNLEAGPMGANPLPAKPKPKRRGTDALAIDDFKLPI